MLKKDGKMLPELDFDADNLKYKDFDSYFKEKGVVGYWVHNNDTRKIRYYVFGKNNRQWSEVGNAFYNDHNVHNPIIENDYVFWRHIKSKAATFPEFVEKFHFTEIWKFS